MGAGDGSFMLRVARRLAPRWKNATVILLDQSSAVEILVEEAVLGSEVDVDRARTEQKAADAELAKWGDKPTDGEYRNVLHRALWAKAQLDAAGAK